MNERMTDAQEVIAFFKDITKAMNDTDSVAITMGLGRNYGDDYPSIILKMRETKGVGTIKDGEAVRLHLDEALRLMSWMIDVRNAEHVPDGVSIPLVGHIALAVAIEDADLEPNDERLGEYFNALTQLEADTPTGQACVVMADAVILTAETFDKAVRTYHRGAKGNGTIAMVLGGDSADDALQSELTAESLKGVNVCYVNGNSFRILTHVPFGTDADLVRRYMKAVNSPANAIKQILEVISIDPSDPDFKEKVIKPGFMTTMAKLIEEAKGNEEPVEEVAEAKPTVH